MERTTTLEHLNVELPIGSKIHKQAQWRRRCIELRRCRSEQEYWRIAGLRVHLKSPQLLLAGLREPGKNGACRIGLDKLFGGSKPFGWSFCIQPNYLVLMQAVLHQARQMGMLWGTDENDLASTCHDALKTIAQQPPLTQGWLRLKYFGQ